MSQQAGNPPDREADRVEKPLLVLGVALAGLFAFGTYAPPSSSFDYGFALEGYASLGRAAFPLAAVALLVLLAVPGAAARLPRALRRRRIHPALRLGLLAIAAGGLFWLLPTWELSGDASTIVYFAAVEHIHPSNALTGYLFRLVEGVLGSGPVTTIRVTSVLSGVLYVISAALIGRECAGEGPRGAGITALLITSGGVALFFGSVEVYAPVIAVMTLYVLFGIRWLHGKGRGIAPPVCLGIAFALHGSAGFLVPSLLLLANRGRLGPIAVRRWASWVALFLVPPVLCFLAVYFGEWHGEPPEGKAALFGTSLGAEGESPLLPLSRSPSDPRQPYALLDLEHATGILNLLLRLAPVGVALFLLGRRPWRETEFRFAVVASLCLFLLANVWNVSYAIRWDWDLFASLGPPVCLAGGLAWFSRERRWESVVRVAALSLFCTLPLVLSNSRREARQDFAEDMETWIGKAVPVELSREVVQGVSEAGVPFDLRTTLERVVVDAVEEVGGLRREFELDRERFYNAVRVALERTDGLEHGPAPIQLARLLTDDLAAEIQAAGSRGGNVPSAGILSFLVTQRTLDRPQLGMIPVNGEMLLLDVMDEVLARGEGIHRRLAEVPPTVWKPVLTRRLRPVVVAGQPLSDPGDWADRLSHAIVEVLNPDRARERGLRWIRLSAAAAKWSRIKGTGAHPGLPLAVARAWWISGLPSLDPAQRTALTEQLARHALRKLPGHPSWLHLLGRSIDRLGRHEEAVPILRKSIEAAPWTLAPRLDLALALRAIGRGDEALPVLERGVRFDSWHRRVPWALGLMVEFRLRRGETEIAESNALEALEDLRRMGPSPEAAALEKHLRGLIHRGGD